MTLKEIQGGSDRIYKDNQLLPRKEWTRLLGVSHDGFLNAIRRGGANEVTRERRGGAHKFGFVIPVGDFPKIIEGLGKSKFHGTSYPIFPWAANVDVSRDFKVTTPSGTTLIYEYPPANIVFRLLRKVIHRR